MKKFKNIHFIGIGGIGMSALAQFYLAEGKNVSGSDVASSEVTELLEKKGISIFLSQDSKNITDDIDLVIYTVAVDQKNPELEEVNKKKIPAITYPEALGLISKDKFTIAISGTHGKTTTTAMIAKIMIDAGLSPTVIAGSIMKEYGSNFVSGQSNYFIIEACEYKRSFLNLNPNILVITNIDSDHLDYYKNLKDIQSSFTELARKLKSEDFLICDINNLNLETVIEDKKVECNIIDYPSISAEKIILQIPGKHNVENAKAALTVATVLNIEENKAIKSLEKFEGTWRRFEKKGKTEKGALIFDDYAHHPSEIKASISSFLEMFPDKKIVIVFQPHLYSRTKLLKKEFGKSFLGASEVILAPIYAAREKEDKSISSGDLTLEIKNNGQKVKNFSDFPLICEYLNENFDSGNIIVTMGAGDIYKVAEVIIK